MTLRRFIFVILLALLPVPAFAQSTLPATRPAAESSQLKKWFDQLDDTNGDARDEARTQLMKIPRSRLAELERVVSTYETISPGQLNELKQIVQHVYLSAEPYAVDSAVESPGFLGVKIRPEPIFVSEPDPRRANDPAAPLVPQPRVAIDSLIPGFAAYPVLREGDVVDHIRLASGSVLTPTNQAEFMQYFATIRARHTVELDIIRDGRQLRIPLTLMVRPATPLVQEGQTGTEFLQHRAAAAKEFWDDTFGKMLEKKGM